MDSIQGIIFISEGNGRVISWPLFLKDEEVVVYTRVVSLVDITRLEGSREVIFSAENVEFSFHLC